MSIGIMNTFGTIPKNKVRVLSFQSREVLDILLKDKIYHPCHKLSREGRDYKLEKDTYGFKDVIWCFSPVGCKTITPNKFIKDDFINGVKFFNFRCEMSLPSNECLNDLFLLELEYDYYTPKPGLTHNACSYVYVIPELTMDNLVAVYRLNYDRRREAGWYYPEVFIEKIYKRDSLFTSNFICKED